MLLLSLSALIVASNAHSWVRCTDYRGVIRGQDYNEGDCEGWIRSEDYSGRGFGVDLGVNQQVDIGGGAGICGGRAPFRGNAANAYRDAYPGKLAKYVAGSTVRVVWPAKNHANYECDANIPDTSMKLFYNPMTDPTRDPPNDQSSVAAQGWELVTDWQEGCTPGTDGCGFQNCPQFCENKDRAPCFGDFTVPRVRRSGYYTFMWYWIFNRNDKPYISCWEAYVSTDGQAPPLPPPSGGNSGGGNNGGGNNGGGNNGGNNGGGNNGGGRGNNGGNNRGNNGGNRGNNGRNNGGNNGGRNNGGNNGNNRGNNGGGNNGGNSGTSGGVQIVNHQNTQEWWLAFRIRGLDNCGNKNYKVQVMGRHPSRWTDARKGYDYYSVNNDGRPFRTPLSVRIGSTTFNDVIRNLNPGETFNAGDMACPSEAVLFDFDYHTAVQVLLVINVLVLVAIFIKKCLRSNKGYEKVVPVYSSDEEEVHLAQI